MRDAFLTTHWSLIEGIHSDNKNHALIDSLLNLYWKPVYCYLRQKHYGNEEAKDKHYLIVGPWDHAGTRFPNKKRLSWLRH